MVRQSTMSGDYEIRFEPSKTRVRVEFSGERIADHPRGFDRIARQRFVEPLSDVGGSNLGRSGRSGFEWRQAERQTHNRCRL